MAKPAITLPPDIAQRRAMEEQHKMMIQQVRIQASIHFMGEQISKCHRAGDAIGDPSDPETELRVGPLKATYYRASTLAIIAADTLVEQLFGVSVRYPEEESAEREQGGLNVESGGVPNLRDTGLGVKGLD